MDRLVRDAQGVQGSVSASFLPCPDRLMHDAQGAHERALLDAACVCRTGTSGFCPGWDIAAESGKPCSAALPMRKRGVRSIGALPRAFTMPSIVLGEAAALMRGPCRAQPSPLFCTQSRDRYSVR